MLMRFDPFRDLDQLMRQSRGGTRFVGMPMDAYRRGDEFLAEFDLPGVDVDSIDVTVERNVLEVSARRAAHYGDEDDVLVAERPQGTVTRQLFLGEGLDAERVTASYDHGVLTVAIPVAKEAKPHRVEITADRGKKAVGAGGAA